MKNRTANVGLLDLISAGLIIPPQEIRAIYLGKNFTANITKEGKIRFKGKTYSSVSTAATQAKKSISDTAVDNNVLKTNGWRFWKYCNRETGKWLYLRRLRSHYLEMEK